jgi:hypothetical protein
MVKRIALVLVVLVAGVLAYAATRPGSLHVERTATIDAAPDRIFPLVNDFHTWISWSSYEQVDPAMKRTYSGAANGKGAVYEWAGNNMIGEGRMEITDASHPSRVTIKLDFIKPLEGHNIAQFTLVPSPTKAGSTTVTWTMDGPTPYAGKLIGMFVNMDTMIGREFETGLANLKAIAERPPHDQAGLR